MKITKKLYKKLIERRKEIDTFSLCGRDERLSEIGWIQYFLEKRYPELTEEPPSKEDLLKKAEEDYPEGTIIYNFLDLSEYVVKSLKLYYPRDGNFGICGQDEESVVYYNNEWAKIIKKPILKINDTFLYEGDEYWNIDKNTFVLENHKITKGYVSGSNNFEYFLTKKEALDYVMVEAKRRYRNNPKCNFPDTSLNGKIVYMKELDFLVLAPINYIATNNNTVWTEEKGFIAEPIKEDVPEWVMPICTGQCKSYIKNTPIKVNKKEKDQYRFDDNKHGIFISRCRPATKAEIEAHKLGFHIGDEVYIDNRKRVIDSFKYSELINGLRCWFTNGRWASIKEITKQKILMLGEYPVTIKDGFINCKDGAVSIYDWAHWAALLKHIKTYALVNGKIELFLGNYKTTYSQWLKTIQIGCIEDATLKQIKKITKEVKKSNKK